MKACEAAQAAGWQRRSWSGRRLTTAACALRLKEGLLLRAPARGKAVRLGASSRGRAAKPVGAAVRSCGAGRPSRWLEFVAVVVLSGRGAEPGEDLD